jgi:hypothetical protein
MRYALVIAMLGRRLLLRRSLSLVTSGSRRLEERANPASLNFGRNLGKTRATITRSAWQIKLIKRSMTALAVVSFLTVFWKKSLRVLEVCDLSSSFRPMEMLKYHS